MTEINCIFLLDSWERKIHLIRSQTQFKWEFYQILARVNLFQFLNL